MLRIMIASFLFMAALGTARASLVEAVSLDTSGLVGLGTFYADFQFTSPNRNNTVKVSQFNFDPKLVETLPVPPGSFFSEIAVPFTPGATLTFQLDLETNPLVVKFPDQLTFFLLDPLQNPLPTGDPLGTNALLAINFAATGPAVTTYESAGPLLGAGPAVSAIPEPASASLCGLVLLVALIVRGRARHWTGRGV